jgi:DNA-binding transcriptional LysR family regulator
VQFKDPLFIPQGRTVRPTAKALAIAQALEPAMAAIQGIIASRSKTGSQARLPTSV